MLLITILYCILFVSVYFCRLTLPILSLHKPVAPFIIDSGGLTPIFTEIFDVVFVSDSTLRGGAWRTLRSPRVGMTLNLPGASRRSCFRRSMCLLMMICACR